MTTQRVTIDFQKPFSDNCGIAKATHPVEVLVAQSVISNHPVCGQRLA